MSTHSIGIDLGTTYSCVAAVEDGGSPRVLSNSHGGTTTPSVVWYGPHGTVVVGSEAKDRQCQGSSGVMAFGKRQMGNPRFLFPADDRLISAVAFSADILRAVKQDAEAALGQAVTRAVVTTPAYFAAPQREATIEAARQAGLEVTQIINEPAAAAIAFAYQKRQGGKFLVYDLGGGTFDVAIVDLIPGEPWRVVMLSYAGDSYLGGKDFDERLTLFVREQARRKHKAELLADPAHQSEWAVLAERHKIALSDADEVEIPYTAGGVNDVARVTRVDFVERCRDLVDRSIFYCERALADANQAWKDIDDILLVGGSTRMPMVRERLERLIGRPPRADVNPDEAVAVGAAYCALGQIEFEEIVAHTLGVIAISSDGKRWVNSPVLRRNTRVGSIGKRVYRVSAKPDAPMHLDVYVTQGDDRNPLGPGCRILARYRADGIPSGSGEVPVEVTFSYDKSATVVVTCRIVDGPSLSVTTDLDLDLSRFREPPPTPVPVHVVMALDVSGSMTGSKLESVRRAAGDFLNSLSTPGSQVGIVAYGNDSRLVSDLTADPKHLRKALSGVKDTREGTYFLPPLSAARGMLRSREFRRFIVLLTDGDGVDQDDMDKALAEAEACRTEGIELRTIGTQDAKSEYLNRIGPAIITSDAGLGDAISSIGREIGGGVEPPPPPDSDDEAIAPSRPAHNLFEALGLSAESTTDELRDRLEQARHNWSRQATYDAKDGGRARVLLDQYDQFRVILQDGAMLDREREEARVAEAATSARRRRELDEALVRTSKEEGCLSPEDLRNIATQTGFSFEDVQKTAAEHGYTIVALTVRGDFQLLPADHWERIRRDLDVVKYASLYELIGATRETKPKELIRRAQDNHAKEEADHSDKARVRKGLYSEAVTLFGNPDLKTRHDGSFAFALLEGFRTDIDNCAGLRKRLTRPEQEELVREMCERGAWPEAAQAFLAAVSKEVGIFLEGKRGPDLFQPKVRCPICERLNAPDSRLCENRDCQTDLMPPCPTKCGDRNGVWAPACRKCGFDLRGRPKADDLARQARRKLEIDRDREAAKRLAEEALAVWPEHPEAMEVLREIGELGRSADEVFASVKVHQGERRHKKALEELKTVADDPRCEKIREVSQTAIDEATRQIAQGQRCDLDGQFDESYVHLLSAQQICADSEATDLLRNCPPMPVPRLSCELQDGHVVLRWDRSPSRIGTIDYMVVSRPNRPPTGPSEPGSEVIASALVAEIQATPLEPGVPTYFAVFARRNGVLARTAPYTDPQLAAADVNNLRAVAGPGSVTLFYTCPQSALRVDVERLDAGGKSLVIGATRDSAVDHGLPDDRTVDYQVVAVYRNVDGAEKRSTGVPCSAIPGAPAEPVDDLRVVLVQKDLVARFTPPVVGTVDLFMAKAIPDLGEGERIARSDLSRLGTPLPQTSPGVAHARLAAGDEVFVTPVTVRGGTYVVGRIVSVCALEAVAASKLKVRALAGPGEFRAEFPWPDGATEVRLLYRSDTEPDGYDDLKATLRRVTPDGPRAYVDLRIPADKPFVYLSAYSLAIRDGRCHAARPASTRIAVGSRRTLFYRVQVVREFDRTGWASWLDKLRTRELGRIKLIKVVIAPNEETTLPRLGLYYHRSRPLDRDGSTLVREIEDPTGGRGSYGPNYALRDEIRLDDNLLEDGGFRLFPLDDDAGEGWRFIDIQG